LAGCDSFRSLLPEGLRPVRSILFDKTPGENWPVAWHQDLTISLAEEHPAPGYGPWSRKDGVVHVQPPAFLLEHMVTIRLHLDDTPASNGALRVIPGSHLEGRLSVDAVARHAETKAVTCECMAGDVLLMRPLLLHSSMRSTAPSRRRVVHIEYARDVDLDPSLEWFEAAIRGMP
jgi:ectoine hydroxylase-related dioxygenase (phytanoyl-CoA dioxygenase family)